MLTGEHLGIDARLRDVSLHLKAGTLMAVVGPNGAGKSTLLKALAGLLPAEGRILWRGKPLASIPFPERGRTLAWLGQESGAEFAFPVRDVVAQGRHAWGDDRRGVVEAMAALELEDLADRPVTQLSGGERRRVFLARALATQAPIQLWDEPTASLDVRHALQVLRIARDLAGRGTALLLSLHDLRAAYRFDRVLVLDRSRVAACGAPHEVLTRELIRGVFGVEATFPSSLVLELPETGESCLG